ncbi:MAG: tetratricopeptide repeat protein [Saprospiraceae bacterium]|nr:tetratricopeptide repeat protein [Candidatus Vicinibacter affinis]
MKLILLQKNWLRKTLDENQFHMVMLCHNKGRILNSKGDYLEAESAYLEAKSVREVVLGKEHPDYLGTLINLATLYNKLTRFDDAEALFIISNQILKKY